MPGLRALYCINETKSYNLTATAAHCEWSYWRIGRHRDVSQIAEEEDKKKQRWNQRRRCNACGSHTTPPHSKTCNETENPNVRLSHLRSNKCKLIYHNNHTKPNARVYALARSHGFGVKLCVVCSNTSTTPTTTLQSTHYNGTRRYSGKKQQLCSASQSRNQRRRRRRVYFCLVHMVRWTGVMLCVACVCFSCIIIFTLLLPVQLNKRVCIIATPLYYGGKHCRHPCAHSVGVSYMLRTIYRRIFKLFNFTALRNGFLYCKTYSTTETFKSSGARWTRTFSGAHERVILLAKWAP